MGFRRSLVISDRVQREIILAVIEYAGRQGAEISHPASPRSYVDRVLMAGPELTDYIFDDDSEYQQAVSASYAFADGIEEMSAEFPGITFAYIDADCFGGTCLYSGFTAANGAVGVRMPPHRRGHRKLLRQVGIWIWHEFPPLRRDYFA